MTQATEKQIAYVEKLIAGIEFEDNAYIRQNLNLTTLSFRERLMVDKGDPELRKTIHSATVEWDQAGRPLPAEMTKEQASQIIDAIKYRRAELRTIWAILNLEHR